MRWRPLCPSLAAIAPAAHAAHEELLQPLWPFEVRLHHPAAIADDWGISALLERAAASKGARSNQHVAWFICTPTSEPSRPVGGVCVTEHTPGRLLVSDLFVDVEFRRRGIATQLLRCVERLLPRKAQVCALVLGHRRFNAGVRRLCQVFSFEAGRDSELVMRRSSSPENTSSPAAAEAVTDPDA